MKGDVHEKMRKTLAKQHACYILITCKEASAGGEMQVQMSYEGDTALASYLLHGAQDYLDGSEGVESDSSAEISPLRLA
ncbi:MAG: hypothetical protein Q8K75_10255 [Chlamydiales bacterium]|nr:hypothetical protein [Chlamydiales bacterium]